MSDEPCDDRPAIGKAAEPANAAAESVVADSTAADGTTAESTAAESTAADIAAAQCTGADGAAPPVSLPPAAGQLSEHASPAPAFAPSRLLAVALTFAGIILPAICFAIGFPNQPYWQSGTWNAYAQLLLSRKNAIPLYPLLLYAMTSLGLVVWRPARWGQRPWVRWGIYSGVVLAAECWLAFLFALSDVVPVAFIVTLIASGLMPLGAFVGWRVIVYVWRKGAGWSVGLFTLLALGALFSYEAFGGVVLVCFACSTNWALASYFYVARALCAARRLSRSASAWPSFSL